MSKTLRHHSTPPSRFARAPGLPIPRRFSGFVPYRPYLIYLHVASFCVLALAKDCRPAFADSAHSQTLDRMVSIAALSEKIPATNSQSVRLRD
jgi:hypothetical protein